MLKVIYRHICASRQIIHMSTGGVTNRVSIVWDICCKTRHRYRLRYDVAFFLDMRYPTRDKQAGEHEIRARPQMWRGKYPNRHRWVEVGLSPV